jgi:hypothetical protein
MKENPIQLEYLKSVLLAQLLLEANESLILQHNTDKQLRT